MWWLLETCKYFSCLGVLSFLKGKVTPVSFTYLSSNCLFSFLCSMLLMPHPTAAQCGNQEAHFEATSGLGLSWTFFRLPLSYRAWIRQFPCETLSACDIVISHCGPGLPGYCLRTRSVPLAGNTRCTITHPQSPPAINELAYRTATSLIVTAEDTDLHVSSFQ